MASRLTDFLSISAPIVVGGVIPTVLNSNRLILGTADAGGSNFINHNRVYLQTEYPRLFESLGLINVTNLIGAEQPIPGASVTGIAYGNEIYVTVGNSSLVQTSTNLVDWTTQTYGVSTNILGIDFIDQPGVNTGLFWTCGANRRVFASPNGSTWISLNTLAQASYRGFAFKDELYVAAGDNGRRGYVLRNTSDEFQVIGIPEGITATQVLTSLDNAPVYLIAGTQLLGSPDGVSWTQRTSGTLSIIRSLAYGNNTYVYGTNGTSTLCLRTSTDSFTWTGRTFGVTATIGALTFGDNLFVAGTHLGAIRTSTDAVTWTARTSGTTSSITSLLYGNNTYVYAGIGGVLATSTNAVTWTTRTSGTTENINALTYGDNLYVYAGDNGVLATSTDAVTWSAQTSGTTENINGLKYANEVFVYAGNNGVIATSTNAINWQQESSNITTSVDTILFGNSQFIVAGASGRTAISRNNGSYWDASVRPFGLRGVVSYNDLYIAFGTNGALQTSTDGKYWIDKDSGTTNAINSLTYENNIYVYAGDNGVVATSSDLESWTLRNSTTTNNISKIDYINGEFVIAGLNGSLAISTDGILWKSALSGTSTNILFSTQSDDLAIYVDNTRNLFFKSLDDKISDLYSSFYNTQTEFFVPNMSSNTASLVATDSNFTQAEYQIYIRGS